MIFDKNYCGSCEYFNDHDGWSGFCPVKQKLCYENDITCESYKSIDKLSEKEFVKRFCHNCGSQRCEGIGTDWFDGCKFKDFLRND